MPAYFNGTVYYGSINSKLQAFALQSGKLGTTPSSQTSGNGNKFITPLIVNGKVFVGTPNGVAVFGLLH